MKTETLEEQGINTVRVLAADAVQKANSGHPGTPMGLAPMGHVLWSEIMNYNPQNPEWANRDRFILSCGHACLLQWQQDIINPDLIFLIIRFIQFAVMEI